MVTMGSPDLMRSAGCAMAADTAAIRAMVVLDQTSLRVIVRAPQRAPGSGRKGLGRQASRPRRAERPALNGAEVSRQLAGPVGAKARNDCAGITLASLRGPNND